MKITVAGVGYVGLSLAVLLAQKHEVTAITTTESKAEKLNQFISPIQDDEIERFFKEVRDGERELNLHTTTDKEAAYKSAELVIIATPTNYDDVNHFFDTSAVEDAIEWTLKVNPDVLMVIKSTIPVGYTSSVREKYGIKNIIFRIIKTQQTILNVLFFDSKPRMLISLNCSLEKGSMHIVIKTQYKIVGIMPIFGNCP